MCDVVIVGAARTPLGDLNKSLSTLSSSDLGCIAVGSALERAQVGGNEVNLCIMGQVLYAGEGQCPARQTAMKAGIPQEVPSLNVNMVCGSGLAAIINATNHIKCNPRDIVVAGGQESMSSAPHLVKMRTPTSLGHAECKDSMVHDALTCAFNHYHMGITAENVASKYSITREEQDKFAELSHGKARQALKEGTFEAEIAPVTIKLRKESKVVSVDDHPRETSMEALARLRPCFKTGGDGTVTPGNCSSINDGAAACVLMSRGVAQSRGCETLARVVSSAMVGCDPALMGMGPLPAIRAALEKANWVTEDVELFEINEAFAAQSIAVVRELGISVDKVNVNGGAIALGHPVGCSGARIVVSLLYEMARTNKKRGVAALCVGGGMGVAICLQRQ